MSKYIVVCANPKEVEMYDEAAQRMVTRYVPRRYETDDRTTAVEICQHHPESHIEMEWQGKIVTLAINHGGTLYTNDITV